MLLKRDRNTIFKISTMVPLGPMLIQQPREPQISIYLPSLKRPRQSAIRLHGNDIELRNKVGRPFRTHLSSLNAPDRFKAFPNKVRRQFEAHLGSLKAHHWFRAFSMGTSQLDFVSFQLKRPSTRFLMIRLGRNTIEV